VGTPAATQAATWALRLGPEVLLFDVLPNGLTKRVQHKLDIGVDDALGTMNDGVYIGVDAIDPRGWTGRYALQNAPNVRLVAVPGGRGRRGCSHRYRCVRYVSSVRNCRLLHSTSSNRRFFQREGGRGDGDRHGLDHYRGRTNGH
jgi:hypothetical protein